MRAPLQWFWPLLLCRLGACEDHQISNRIVDAGKGVTTTTSTPLVNHRCEEANLNLEGSCGRPRDCAEIAWSGHVRSDVYRVWPDGWKPRGMQVYCDLEEDGGGWTVIQRRGQFGNPKDFFFRRWRDYKFGFGNLRKEFWLGNDNIHYMSNQDNYVLRVNLKDHANETRYAQYEEFYLEDETNKYRLWIEVYEGNAGDSLNKHNGMFFSTVDRDNDKDSGSCSDKVKGAWWYYACLKSNLNGLNHNGIHAKPDGINWHFWKGWDYSYLEVEMKIRPKTYP